MMEIKLHPPDKKVGASASVATWCTVARSLSTETEQNTQEVEDDGQENDAWNTQATIPSETRQVLCFTQQWATYTQVLNFTKNWQLTHNSQKAVLSFTYDTSL